MFRISEYNFIKKNSLFESIGGGTQFKFKQYVSFLSAWLPQQQVVFKNFDADP